MEQLKVNPNNKKYYSEDFIKGFECGAKRQFEADRKEGEWIEDGYYDYLHYVCSNCGQECGVQNNGVATEPLCTNYCPNCGAKMKGADDELL